MKKDVSIEDSTRNVEVFDTAIEIMDTVRRQQNILFPADH